MLAQLEVTFGSLHAATTAHRTLSRLMFDIRNDDINTFMSKVNTLINKGGYSIDGAQGHAVQLPASWF